MVVDKAENKKGWAQIKPYAYEALLYVSVFLLTFVLFILVRPFVKYANSSWLAHSIPILTLVAGIAFVSYMGATKRLKARHIVILLLIFGYALRIGYTLASPATAHQHDVFTSWFDGHEAYAWTLFETGDMPVKNDYQMYHPPLNAMVQAGFMHIMQGVAALMPGLVDGFSLGLPKYLTPERYYLYTSCQILSVTWSFIVSVISLKILKTFRFSEKTYLLLAAVVVLYPRNIQFATMLNNDGIAYMFMMASLLFALRWWSKKSIAYILPCGVCVGLGMMAKLSAATICAPIAGIFIYEFVCTLRKKEGSLSLKQMVLQYGVFLAVCAPIGLWFQVYANLRFNQSFGHVFSNLTQKLYTGDKSLFERFFIAFDLSEYFGSLYCRSYDNYNLFNFALRSSVFGEHGYRRGHIFGAFAVIFAYMVAIFLVILLIYCLVSWIKKRKSAELSVEQNPSITFKEFLFTALLIASQVLSEIYFYIKMPYGCTMDFRYIMPLILGIALTIGFVQNALAASKSKLALACSRVLTFAVIGFLANGALFYCICI